MLGRKYTWANSLQTPTYEKLDRILMATEWEEKFPLSNVIALNRDISDHTPLLLNTRDSPSSATQHQFKFEPEWLLRDGFMDMVKEVWESVDQGPTPMETWQAKIRRLHQHLRGWSKNTSGKLKKEKKKILDKLDSLDKKAETCIISPQEVDLKQYLKTRQADMLREEEIKCINGQRLRSYLNVTQTPNTFS